MSENLGRRERRLRKEAISEEGGRLIMLFRMGQCLKHFFKEVREAEGYYRGARGRPLHRRSLEKDDQWARGPLLASRTPTATWRAVLTPGPALLPALLKNSDRLEEAEVHYREAIASEQR